MGLLDFCVYYIVILKTLNNIEGMKVEELLVQ